MHKQIDQLSVSSRVPQYDELTEVMQIVKQCGAKYLPTDETMTQRKIFHDALCSFKYFPDNFK